MIKKLVIVAALSWMLGAASLAPAALAQGGSVGGPIIGQPWQCDTCTAGINWGASSTSTTCSLNLRWIGQFTGAVCLIPVYGYSDCLPAACSGSMTMQYSSVCDGNDILLYCSGFPANYTNLPSTGGTWANVFTASGQLGCKLAFGCIAQLTNPADAGTADSSATAFCASTTGACPSF